MIVKAELNRKRVKSSYRLSYLNKDNSLKLLDEQQGRKARKAINKLSWLIKYNLYRPYMFARKVFISTRNSLLG